LLDIAVSHPTAADAMAFLNELSSGSSSDDDFVTCRVYLSPLYHSPRLRVVIWN
jgi:hypothetical protein